VILGSDELAKGVVAVKDMLARKQVEVKLDELPAEIERRLAAPESA
jgi:histidyl-tRNA synthetase